jgi:hypothetical protein
MLWADLKRLKDPQSHSKLQYKLIIPAVMKTKILECIENGSKIIIISYSLFSYTSEKSRSHRNVIIINKYLKTIELYDPNGGIFHRHKYKNQDIPFIKKFFKTFPELKDYRIVKYDQVWKKGFQYYESKAMKLLNEKGKCMVWSLFLAELRIRYYNIHPEELFVHLLGQLEKNREPEFLKQFIKDYMMYIQKQIDPLHSPHIYSLIPTSAKDIFNKQEQLYIPAWERRDDFNTLFETSMLYLRDKYPDICIAFIPTDGKISDKLIAWIDIRSLSYKLNSDDIVMQMTGGRDSGFYVCPLVRAQIVDCLKNPDIKMIIVPISLLIVSRKNGKISGHKINLVINHYLNTVELYDPNGAKSHTKMTGDLDIPYIQKFIRSFPRIKSYKFFDYKSINPDAGFQKFESIAKKHELKNERAKCAFWSTLLADIRCKYYYVQPDILITKIIQQVKEQERPRVFYKLIQDYITYNDIKLGRRHE